MSFGGFGGFGSNNNNQQQQQQSTGFGGFGATNNTTPAFGSNTNTNTGFGSTANTGGGGGLFGNNNATANNNQSTGFGGFGGATNTTGGFGSKPAFGASTSGGLFGANANTAATTTTGTGFGGFGGATNNTTSAFGSAAGGGGGAFGSNNNTATQNKPAFGATGGGMFGSTNNTTSTGFGGGGFGASTNPGLTGASGDPPGTANTAFQAFTEKEPNSTGNMQNAFQHIVFQDPYKKWSTEELRLADYAQGRKHGNPSGAGAFGVSSGFGGGAFGATNNQQSTGFGSTANNTSTGGGLFGSNQNNTTTTGFGQTNTNNNNPFGGAANNAQTNTGGLFGAAKPATGGGLFGGGAAQTNTTGGGLFGSNAGGGFGSTTNNNAAGTTTGFGAQANTNTGGLFGSSNNQPKTGFGFGTAQNTNTSTGFGNTTNNAFGANNTNTNTGTGLFGNANNTTNTTGGGLFGGANNNQQQQQTGSAFGGGFGQQSNQAQQGGSSLFGNNQPKPAGGLFGAPAQATTTGGGLFGGNTNQQQPGNAFGATNNATAGGGLFGAANKPAGGTGLFGATNNQNTGTGGGLFGGLGSNNQAQQSTGGGLFGGQNNQQKPAGLFGASTQNTGGGLFGGQTNQNQGSSLFGASANQQQQNQGFGNSMLGNSQQANNAPQGLTANLNDVSAFGSPSLFSNVGGNEVSNPGPLATPLNGASKPRRSSILPMYKLAPASASRYGTPQKNNGFGFSYSTYGTPGGSPASSIASTPGTLGRSLLGASHSGSLSKSVSMNSLRRSHNVDDSILAPGAFSANSGSRWYGSTGSSKKLVINRELRSDLFSTPTKDRTSDDTSSSRKLRKSVSFANADNNDGTPVRAALPAPEEVVDSQAEDTPRQIRTTNSLQSSQTPTTDQSNGESLAVAEREDSIATPEGTPSTGFENAAGSYWTSPPLEEIRNMNRMQRQKIDNFEIGRENIGSIFFKFPVDMSSVELDELCGEVIQLEPRSATVYPIAAKKPPVGKGLNVPARITLEQSWPRSGRDRRVASDPKRFNKHVERLKRIPDTTFESYDQNTGVWIFHVEHFTTYGLDDSEDETDADMEMDTAEPTREVEQQVAVFQQERNSFTNSNSSMPRSPADIFPGAFEEAEMQVTRRESFLGDSSADSAPKQLQLSLEAEPTVDMGEGYDLSEDEDMARSSPGQHLAAEQDDVSFEDDQSVEKGTPGGILRARNRALKKSVGVFELEVAGGDDWMEMLRNSVSPVKRDRRLLRELNDSPSRGNGNLIDFDDDNETDLRRSSVWRKSAGNPSKATGANDLHATQGFATSIDLMNSLFEKPRPRQNMKASVAAKGFPKFPYDRQDKTVSIDENEQAFHNAGRPTWGPDGTLIVTRPAGPSQLRRSLRDSSGVLNFQRSSIQTDKQDVRFAKLSSEPSKKYLQTQDKLTDIMIVDNVPAAKLRASRLESVFHNQDMNDPPSVHEKRVWELASILFDDIERERSESLHIVRKSELSNFWTDLVDQSSSTAIGLAGSSDEKALACLTGNRIAEACKHLLDGKNFRLATLIPLIGLNDDAKEDMREQIKEWHDSKMLSEFSDSIRTIYELLGGNVCVCEGMKGKGVIIEDRMESFVISEKFGLDWKRAFGLRLWYAISRADDLASAVRKFAEDISQDREGNPRPWFAEQGINPIWNDTRAGERQDLLWGLLQLYANEDADLEAILRPENSQLSPLDMRLTWQLGLALTTSGKVSYGRSGKQKADAATVAYASQLTSAGEWLEAIFVLLHLSDSNTRQQAIQEHLCRHAGLIGQEPEVTFVTLTDKFQIPPAWIWEARALFMRSVKKEPSEEVHCLLRAGSFVEAHRVLSQQVAPLAIIEREYAALADIVAQFDGHQNSIPEWQLGGEIYSQFLTLMQHRAKGENSPRSVLDKLLAGLHAMSDAASETEILRYAAISDMADETAREILKLTRKKQDLDLRSRILKLPLTQDRLLSYSVNLGMERYREVMSH